MSHFSSAPTTNLLAEEVQICCGFFKKRGSFGVMHVYVAVCICQNVAWESAGSQFIQLLCAAKHIEIFSCCDQKR